jgi:hypothetical protein
MCRAIRVAVTIVTIGMAATSLANPARAGNGSAVGAGLLGFGVGALVGSAVTPQTVYVAPPPPVYYAPPPPVYVAPAPVYVAPVYVGTVYDGHPHHRGHRH